MQFSPIEGYPEPWGLPAALPNHAVYRPSPVLQAQGQTDSVEFVWDQLFEMQLANSSEEEGDCGGRSIVEMRDQLRARDGIFLVCTFPFLNLTLDLHSAPLQVSPKVNSNIVAHH